LNYEFNFSINTDGDVLTKKMKVKENGENGNEPCEMLLKPTRQCRPNMYVNGR